jgi:hypothetical protein
LVGDVTDERLDHGVLDGEDVSVAARRQAVDSAVL